MSDSRVIIGVHGLKNKPREPNLTKLWKQAIADGLRRNAGRNIQIANLPFEHGYWADLGYRRPEPNRKYQGGRGRAPYPEYKESLLDSARALFSDITDEPVEWAKEWLGMTRAADKFLKKVFEDLARYYGNEGYREKVRGRVIDQVLAHQNKRILLIAHSMGSIIAYDALRILGRTHPDITINRLVTIGSPLGLPHVMHRIEQEHGKARTPSNVLRWTNMAERFDPVAFDTHLHRDFGANADGVRVKDDLVLNNQVLNEDGDTDYHASIGYLRTPEMSRLINTFL